MKQTAVDNYKGALQQPIGSGFGAGSTTMDVMKGIDLAGKTAIVTGGYAGIGLETVKAFVAAGARVIVPARDVAKARKNLEGMENVRENLQVMDNSMGSLEGVGSGRENLDGRTHVTLEVMDLMDPVSIDAFAARFLATGCPLDLLVNNAGIMWVPLQRDARGYESQLSTNHLGHFQLTARLWPALRQSGDARVINVSSFGHTMAPFNFEDPNFEHRSYETLAGYGQSKTANNLFTVELDHRSKEFGVRAYSVHPGSVNGTDLGRVAPMELFKQMGTHDADGNIFPEVARKLKTLSQGAATTVWCATSPALAGIGGVYCEDADVAAVNTGNIVHKYDDPSTLRGVMPYSVDGGNAQRLWALSEEMTGIRFEMV